MTVDILQQKKEEVAGIYLKDLKEELGFLKGSIVGLFGGTIKGMMTSTTPLGEAFDTSKLNFREKMLASMSPITAEKVFAFIKEKQEMLQKAKTEAELDNLKAGIIPAAVVTTATEASTVDETTTETATTESSTTDATPATNEESDKTEEDKAKEADEDKAKEADEDKAKEADEDKAKETDENKANKKENIYAGVGVGGGLGLSVLATEKIYKLQESKKIAKNIDLKTSEQFANKMKAQFQSLSDQLAKEAALNPKLTKFQSKALSKSAKEFEKVATSMDGETLDAVKMLGDLNKKLPASMLKNIDPSQAKKLLGLTLTEDVLAEIKLGKTPAAVEGLSKEVITVLKNAANLDEAKSMIYVLTKSKGVEGFLKGIRGIAFLDLISTGFDVRVLCEGLDEAEAYRKLNEVRSDTKREHQWVQFGASVAITAIGIIGTCAAAGSVVPGLGTAIGVVVGALGYAASVAIDIYYDKVEFYLQNEADFKKQYRTEIKQAIIQSAGAEELQMNEQERMHATVEKGIPLSTTKDAWKALVRQEEYKKSEYTMIQKLYFSDKKEEDFLIALSEEEKTEYKKQKTAINTVIDKRMEYIKLFMYENKNTKEYKVFAAAMKSGMGIKKIEKILADSKTYYDMNQTGADQYVTGCSAIDDYQKKYGAKLKGEDATKFAELETMRTAEPYKFLEIYYGVESFESIFENQKKEETDQNKVETIQKNIDFIKRFYTYKMMGLPIEEQKKLDLSVGMMDNKNTETMLSTGKFTVVNTYTEDSTKWYFTNTGILKRMETKVEVSDRVGQNIIYRIATEIHGYTGSNDEKELIEFFSMGKENATGLYYDNKWIVNNDWAIDKGIDINAFETMTTETILKERTRSNNRNKVLEYAVPNPLGPVGASLGGAGIYSVYGFTDDASIIDTTTEGMDDKLNEEYRKRVSSIVAEEKGYSVPATKKIVEQKIIDYISTNAKDGGYIELPYYLIIAAKKAKIGDLQKYLFAYKDNKIVACTTKIYLTEKLDFTQTNTNITKEYVSGTAESVGENTQKYIDYVDGAKTQFENLITYDVNELDIPREYLEIYKAKITERETLKASMLTLDATTAKSQLESQYEKYHDYFENMYMAMLSVMSNFGASAFSSNDLDSTTYHQQVESVAAQIGTVTIDKGIITGPIDQMTEHQKKLFYATIASQKIDGKNIIELAKSKDVTEKNKAIRGAKQIVKSILESEVLIFDAKGNIQNIGHGENAMNLTLQLTKRLDANIGKATYFDPSKYTIEETPTDDTKITIKTLTEGQENVAKETNEVEKIIKATEPDIAYPGRGLVVFDPETNLLTSRGKKIKIDATKFTIDGLTTKFATLKELVMTANLMNWFKYKYPGVKDFYFGSRLGMGMDYGIYRSENGVDTQILDLDTIKEKYATILDSNNDIKAEIITYINAIT